MKAVWVLALMTWTELRRDRFVIVLAFVAFLLLVLTLLLGSLSLDEQVRMLVHLGFASFQMTLTGLALFLGAWTLQKEIDKQTCLLVLSRPISRAQFFLGKWGGCLMLLVLFWMAAGLLHWALLDFRFLALRYWGAHLTLLLECVTALSLAFFGASFLRPLLALAMGLVVVLAGHWREDILFFANRTKNAYFEVAGQVAQWVFPPLDRIEIRSVHFLTENEVVWPFWSMLHLIFWSTLLLFFAQLIWRRRDLV